jgi:hypothetical protein
VARYPRSSRRAAFVLCVLALAAWAPSAHGQADDKSTDRDIDKARTLFREARALVAERQYSEACRKFGQSLAIERGIGTMYNLADCWEKLGKTASAHAMFISTATAARSLSQPDRARTATERAAALEPRLSRLLVTVGTPADGITVWRGKKQIDQAAWGTPIPIDPGIYEIRATAPGKQPWTARVEIPELSPTATTISVTVPPLTPESKNSAAVAAATAPSKPKATGSTPPERKPLPPPETPPAADSSSGSNSRIIALSVGAAGVGALVAGVVLVLDYKSKNDEASDICPTAVNCSRAEVDRHAELTDDARSSRNWAYLAFGVGGAAILGAGAIYVTSRRETNASPWSASARHATKITVTPLAGAKGPLGAVVHGSW